MNKLPSDFPDIDLPAWNDALPMPEASRPLALRRNAQPVLDTILGYEPDLGLPPTVVNAPAPSGVARLAEELPDRYRLSPFEARGLRRRK